MIDWDRIEGFDWDDGNGRKSAHKNSVSQREAEQLFLSNRLLVVQDFEHSRSEPRFQAIGQTLEGRHLHVTFTLRQQDTKIRVISARSASRKERARYEQEA